MDELRGEKRTEMMKILTTKGWNSIDLDLISGYLKRPLESRKNIYEEFYSLIKDKKKPHCEKVEDFLEFDKCLNMVIKKPPE